MEILLLYLFVNSIITLVLNEDMKRNYDISKLTFIGRLITIIQYILLGIPILIYDRINLKR